MGVAEYIRKKRLEYAHGLLKSGELQIAEVSGKKQAFRTIIISAVYIKNITEYRRIRKSHPKAF